MGNYLSLFARWVAGRRQIDYNPRSKKQKFEKGPAVMIYDRDAPLLTCHADIHPASSDDEDAVANNPSYPDFLMIGHNDRPVGTKHRLGKIYTCVIVFSGDNEVKYGLIRVGQNLIRHVISGHPESNWTSVDAWSSDIDDIIKKPPIPQLLESLDVVNEYSILKTKIRPLYHVHAWDGGHTCGDLCEWRYLIHADSNDWANSRVAFHNNFCRDCDDEENARWYHNVHNEQ